jgi:molecular chaperone GrpE
LKLTVEEQLTKDLAQEKISFEDCFAEFENYKDVQGAYRVVQNSKSRSFISDVAVLDDFDRAITEIAKSEDEVMTKGVALYMKKSTLVGKGLK